MRDRPHLRYLIGLGAATLILAAATLTLNLLVDPLWYARGNRLTGVNYLFNERLAKSNLFLQRPEAYDCVIFGSSRTTLLNPRRIEGRTCFNYAFSLGQGYEYVQFAEYAKSFGLSPELVIVGVDGEDFTERTDGYNVPAFVAERRPPPGVLESYLSLGTTKLSLRTLFGNSPLSRFSRPDFTVDIVPGIAPGDHRRPAVAETGAPHRLDNLVHYERLRAIFPDATFIGYVPPISPVRVKVLKEEGRFGTYLDAIYQVSRLFDRFYDFSIPNAVTANDAYTHDGSHYRRPVNADIAAILTGRRPADVPSTFGVPLHQLTETQHEAVFRQAAGRYLEHGKPGLSHARHRAPHATRSASPAAGRRSGSGGAGSAGQG